MKNNNKKINIKSKIMSTLILCWILFFAVSGVYVFAVNNTLSQPVQLSFEGTTATNLTVIRGVNIVINATNTADRAPLKQPIKLVKYDEDGSGGSEHTQYFGVSGEKHKMTLHPYLSAELDPADQVNAPVGNYTITSNYGTMKWDADIANQVDSTGRAAGTLSLIDTSGKNGLNILTDSYFKMK